MFYFLIRHAESVGNAGGRTETNEGISLTERGHQQAEKLAQKLCWKPDLIVVSSFIRTQLTARPLISRFPDVPVETWEVQEFTYLDTERCRNTTQQERFKMRETYFQRNDLDWVDGTGAESFNHLIGRAKSTLQRIDPDKITYICTHGLFMKSFLMNLYQLPIKFEIFREMPPIDNTQVIMLKKDRRLG